MPKMATHNQVQGVGEVQQVNSLGASPTKTGLNSVFVYRGRLPCKQTAAQVIHSIFKFKSIPNPNRYFA